MLSFDNDILKSENDNNLSDLDEEKITMIDNGINIFVNLSISENIEIS